MKNITKLSLLLLLGTLQPCLYAKKEVRPTKQQQESEKMRLTYLAISKPPMHGGHFALPRYPLHWTSLPRVKNVTPEQIKDAKDIAFEQEATVQKLEAERTNYLAKKYPVMKEVERLSQAITDAQNAYSDYLNGSNRPEIQKAFDDPKYQQEIYTAQIAASKDSWKYWNLQRIYNQEQAQHSPWGPYAIEKASLEEISLEPGDSYDLGAVMQQAVTPVRGKLVGYTIQYTDGKKVAPSQAVLKKQGLSTDPGVPGARSFVNYTLMINKKAHADEFLIMQEAMMMEPQAFAKVTIDDETVSGKHATGHHKGETMSSKSNKTK